MSDPDIRYTMPDDPLWGWEFRCEWFVFARIADDERAAQSQPAPRREATLTRLAEHSTYVA